MNSQNTSAFCHSSASCLVTSLCRNTEVALSQINNYIHFSFSSCKINKQIKVSLLHKHYTPLTSTLQRAVTVIHCNHTIHLPSPTASQLSQVHFLTLLIDSRTRFWFKNGYLSYRPSIYWWNPEKKNYHIIHTLRTASEAVVLLAGIKLCIFVPNGHLSPRRL